ncbi:hypothetical protein BS78_07G135100 [Paspalum vaginatum]|nr:hypothetical protein BS78_07G135100 [Paspalum vaginatum]
MIRSPLSTPHTPPPLDHLPRQGTGVGFMISALFFLSPPPHVFVSIPTPRSLFFLFWFTGPGCAMVQCSHDTVAADAGGLTLCSLCGLLLQVFPFFSRIRISGEC